MMTNHLRDGLDIFFRRISPDAILHERHAGSYTKPRCYEMPDQRMFRHILLEYRPEYSPDEADNLFSFLRTGIDSRAGIFGLLHHSMKDILRLDRNSECMIRFDRLLDFRELAHPIGPSLFASAYIAGEDVLRRRKNGRSFSTNPVLRTDNLRLNGTLEAGFAENHFHLNGSSHAFLFSWVCLMNHVVRRRGDFQRMGIDSMPLDNRPDGFEQASSSFYSLIWRASYIRLFFFEKLNYNKPDMNDEVEKRFPLLAGLSEMEDLRCQIHAPSLQAMLHAAKHVYAPPGAIDYAIPRIYRDQAPYSREYRKEQATTRTEERVYEQLSGEMRFLYDLFSAIYAGEEWIQAHLDLAYFYLVVWSRFRGELIQTNNRTGFANFQNYQDRKDIFTDSYPHYKKARTRMALGASLSDTRTRSLEARCMPATTAPLLAQRISEYDSLAVPHDANKLHYVIHFPKFTVEQSHLQSIALPRSHAVRQKAATGAQRIIQLRESRAGQAHRITGIDACSNEIGCRPEVFAHVFRLLRGHVVSHDPLLGRDGLRKLRVTFHAGEDFYDPLDGMRAIDEAMTFLDFSNGDRLGHALALGVDVEGWYAQRGNRLLMPAQDILDNVVWLYNKMEQYGISTHLVEAEVQSLFGRYFTKIVRTELPFSAKDHTVDINIYWNSWLLRGDDPFYYRRAYDINLLREDLSEAPPQALLAHPDANGFRSSDWQACYLYHNYHFNPGVKEKGKEIVGQIASPAMIEAIAQVQRELQKEVARKNIGIECNPSSNLLIGTFRRLDKHPILRFFDAGIWDDPDNPRLFVSINTDDQGVFDTCLENEYALMACAMEQYDGPKKIPPHNIYVWLDTIRRMGIEQSFQ